MTKLVKNLSVFFKKFTEKISRRAKLFFLISFLFLIIFFSMFYYSVQSSLWLKYPLSLRAPIAFAKLGLSSYRESLCHEECSVRRALAKETIIEALKDNNQPLFEKIMKVLKNKDESIVFKSELIKVMSAVFGKDNPPAEMTLLLTQGTKEEREILWDNFNFTAAVWQDFYQKLVLDKDADLQDRKEALQKIAFRSEVFLPVIDSLLAEGGVDLEMLPILVEVAASLPDKSILTADFLSKISKYLPISSEKTKNAAVFIAGEMVVIWPEQSLSFLAAVTRSSSMSIFTRYFAIEELNRYLEKNSRYLLPEINANQWESYLAGDNL